MFDELVLDFGLRITKKWLQTSI